MSYIKRRCFIFLVFFFQFIVFSCVKTTIEKSEGRREACLKNDFVHIVENTRVERLLIQYSRGTYNNIRTINDEDTYERLNIVFMTDSHLDLGLNVKENFQNVNNAIDFCNNAPVKISAIIEGGDIVTEVKKTKREHIENLNKFFALTWKAKMPFLYAKGNHDINALRVPPNDVLTDDDWGNVWFDRAEERYGIVRNIKSCGQKSGYYYDDLNEWKVRIICLDCYDLDYSKTDFVGNVLYRAGTSHYFANEQFNWIANNALNFDDKKEKDWGVIVFVHFYRPTDSWGTSVEPIFNSVFMPFNDMLRAFNNQSVFDKNEIFDQNNFYNLSIHGDWTRYAGEEKKPFLICILSGHVHTDEYHNWSTIHHIVTANQFCGSNYSDKRIIRVPGTSTENLFDILNIDLFQRKIRVIRYGAGVTCYGTGGDRFLPDGLSF